MKMQKPLFQHPDIAALRHPESSLVRKRKVLHVKKMPKTNVLFRMDHSEDMST